MDRFIARENIRRFKKQLANCSDERQRETLNELLAAEEEKLKELNFLHAARPKQYAPEIEESPTALCRRIAETERLANTSDEMRARHDREREEDDNQDKRLTANAGDPFGWQTGRE